MSNTNDLLNRINAKYSTMSKGHKLLATYITDNYDKAVFLTAAKMGETVGISSLRLSGSLHRSDIRDIPIFRRHSRSL